jgi:hypothetical protein
LLKPDCLGGLRISQRLHVSVREAGREHELVGVNLLCQVRLQFFRRAQNLAPTVVFLLETLHRIGHLVFVSRGRRAGHAASDIRAFGGAGTERDMSVKIVRVVVETVGVANRIVRVKPLRKFSHHFFHGGLQNAVGIDTGLHQLVVKSLRHCEDEPMLNDWIFRR